MSRFINPPKACSNALFYFLSHSECIFPPTPNPPFLIIQLYQGGDAFFCPAWMWKVRPVIKPVITQTWEKEVDHWMSPLQMNNQGACVPFLLSFR